MASRTVKDAVEARLAANWTNCPIQGINLEGETPADASPFLMVQYPVSEEQQITIGAPGNNVWREEGALRFILSIARGTGVDQGLTWIEELRSLFRGKQFSHVSTWAPSAAVLDDTNDAGNYWRLTFAVPYYFDING